MDFSGIFKKTIHNTLLIPVHVVTWVNNKKIMNEGFHCYLNKLPKINSAEKGSLHQWLQGICFEFYAWNKRPVDGTDIFQPVVDIGR